MAKVLTTGRPWRVILVFCVPLLIGNVVQQLYQVADAVVVGRVLGVDSLAAVGAVGGLLFLLFGVAWGMTSGFAIPTAQAFGAGDHAAVRRSVATGTVLTAVASVVISAVALVLVGPALRLLQTPPELYDAAYTFAWVSFAGATSTMAYNYLASVIRAIGDSRTPLVFLVVSCVLNIALVLLLVAVGGHGVGGAALATVISQTVSVALCLWYVARRVPVLHVRRADFRLERADLTEHLRLGIPLGFQSSVIAIGTLVVQLRLNELGADAVAAYTTAARVDGLAVALLASLGLAVSTFAAQNLGARQGDRIRRGVVQAVWMSVAGGVSIAVVLIAFGPELVELFVGPGEEKVVEMAALFLAINGAMYVVLGVLFVLRGALQGLGQAAVPTLTGVVELVMRAGAAIFLGAAFGYAGVVWSNPLAWIGAVVLLVPAYVRAHRALAGLRPGGEVAPQEPGTVALDEVLVEGPAEGSLVVDAVVPQPRATPDGVLEDAPDDASQDTPGEVPQPAHR